MRVTSAPRRAAPRERRPRGRATRGACRGRRRSRPRPSPGRRRRRRVRRASRPTGRVPLRGCRTPSRSATDRQSRIHPPEFWARVCGACTERQNYRSGAERGGRWPVAPRCGQVPVRGRAGRAGRRAGGRARLSGSVVGPGCRARWSGPVVGLGGRARWSDSVVGERSTLRCPRRPTSMGSPPRPPPPLPPDPAARSWGRAASRTALARASRSSPLGRLGADPSESRTTSQPRGAVRRSLCSAHRS